MKKTTAILCASLALMVSIGFFGFGFRARTALADEVAAPVSVADTNAWTVSPSPDDGRIAYITARLLERMHYSRHRFDDSLSSDFLDDYLEALDPQRVHFLQSDIDGFERWRTNLDDLTLSRNGVAVVTPGFEIFDRFVERLQQRVNYVDDLLDHEKFTFDTEERITLNRKDAPYPEDMKAAEALWKQRLRYEYLQEELSLKDPEKAKATPAKTDSTKSIHDQIVDTLKHRYHRNLRLFTDWNHEDVLGLYLTSLAHAYDPHSDFFTHQQMDEFRLSMNLQLFGIGAELRSEDGYCKIQRLLPGPAAKSKKIKEGDSIIAVAQSNQPPVDIVDMSLTKVVQLIRGPKGSEVRLTIVPAADPSDRKVITLLRDEIPLEDKAAKGKIIDYPRGGKRFRLGVIDLPSFYAPMELGASKESEASGHSTSADVARLLNKFKQEHVDGVILDLRHNGGGSLEEAIRLTGLFIKDGPVVQVKGFDGNVVVEDDEDSAVTYAGPLIVLTSRFSASASEIVAGALQDYGRAIIVGDSSTHGKGTVQNLNSLAPFLRLSSATNDPGALKVTIRKFYRASGASTQLKGVIPDIVLPSVLNYWKDLGESSLDRPLPWDVIDSASYQKLNLVQPYLGRLLRQSNERVATNQDFDYIREDIAQYRKIEADKTVSLNEKDRLKEMKEAEERMKARDRERLARGEPPETVYEITLKQAALPGLPAPMQRTNSVALQGNSNGTNSVGSNAVSVTSSAAGETVPGEDAAADDLKPPAVDADLEESARIMMDYVSLLPPSARAGTASSDAGR